MKKIFKMSIHEIKQMRKLLTVIAITILVITLAIFFTRDMDDTQILMLAFADILEKTLFPIFAYIGIKNYVKSLSNSVQINQKRSDYFLSKSLSMIIVSLIVAIIVTPLSYYFATLAKFSEIEPVLETFIGLYYPVIPVIFRFSNVYLVTIISALIYILLSHASLLLVVIYNKIGALKLFGLYIISVFILLNINRMISVEKNGADIMDRILGFSGVGINLMTPVISLSLITLTFGIISYLVINRTEV